MNDHTYNMLIVEDNKDDLQFLNNIIRVSLKSHKPLIILELYV